MKLELKGNKTIKHTAKVKTKAVETKELSTIIRPELYSGLMMKKVGMVSMFKDRQTKRLLTDICGDIITAINCRDILTVTEFNLIKQSLNSLFDKAMQKAITEEKVTRLDLREFILYGVEEIKETMISNLQLINMKNSHGVNLVFFLF